jgi:hypothetical protein
MINTNTYETQIRTVKTEVCLINRKLKWVKWTFPSYNFVFLLVQK